jgi:hypothetical protein
MFFRPSPNWSRRLPRLLTIPTVMELKTLADVRDVVEKHLPAPYRQPIAKKRHNGQNGLLGKELCQCLCEGSEG